MTWDGGRDTSGAKLRPARAALQTPAPGLTPRPLLLPTSTSDLCLNRKTFFGGFYGCSFTCSSSGTRPGCALPCWIKFARILLFCVLKYSIKSSDQKSIALRIPGYLLLFFPHCFSCVFSLFLSTVKPKQKKWRKKKKAEVARGEEKEKIAR